MTLKKSLVRNVIIKSDYLSDRFSEFTRSTVSKECLYDRFSESSTSNLVFIDFLYSYCIELVVTLCRDCLCSQIEYTVRVFDFHLQSTECYQWLFIYTLLGLYVHNKTGLLLTSC